MSEKKEIVSNTKVPGNYHNSPVIMRNDDPDSERGKKKAEIFNKLWTLRNKRGIPKFNDTNEMAMLIEQYFSDCAEIGLRPTIRGLASSLGTTYRTLIDWENGSRDETLGSECSQIIKNAKQFVAEYDEMMALEGIDNPVLFMFRAKNYFGLKDVQDVTIQSNNALGSKTTVDEIENAIPKDLLLDNKRNDTDQ